MVPPRPNRGWGEADLELGGEEVMAEPALTVLPGTVRGEAVK
jgi:hypothetical protein